MPAHILEDWDLSFPAHEMLSIQMYGRFLEEGRQDLAPTFQPEWLTLHCAPFLSGGSHYIAGWKEYDVWQREKYRQTGRADEVLQFKLCFSVFMYHNCMQGCPGATIREEHFKRNQHKETNSNKWHKCSTYLSCRDGGDWKQYKHYWALQRGFSNLSMHTLRRCIYETDARLE